MQIEQKITSLIEPALESLEYELVRVKHMGQDVLQIMIDSENGVNIDDCTKATHLIRSVLQVAEMADIYNLEVSSPGIDRPLIKPAHYIKFTGNMVKLNSQSLIDGQKRFLGKLTDFDNVNHVITLSLEDKVVKIPLEQVHTANLYYEYNNNKKMKKG